MTKTKSLDDEQHDEQKRSERQTLSLLPSLLRRHQTLRLVDRANLRLAAAAAAKMTLVQASRYLRTLNIEDRLRRQGSVTPLKKTAPHLLLTLTRYCCTTVHEIMARIGEIRTPVLEPMFFRNRNLQRLL